MDTNKTTQLVLKSINQLLDYKFYIPAYQRGYRWTETQVIQLLEDIWSFAHNPPKAESGQEEPFYCLQPIVVKKRNEQKNEWEVIDGQQRLTTIVLIIHYFNEMWIGKHKIKEPQIFYETRRESENFISQLEIDINSEVEINLRIKEALNNIKLISYFEPENNIDFYHIAKAYKTIHFWVLQMGDKLDNNKFQSVFKHRTKVIWYEAEETESNNSIDIFTRLNIGKIPLTNAELIKALFLQTRNFSEEQATLKQIQIASEWDNMEKTLQDDAFWYFIYNPDNPIKYENRIEYIFDLMKKRTKESEYYHTFNKFNEAFPQKSSNYESDIDKIWEEVKEYFLTFEEWFKDDELFHYIGYLIDCIDKPKNKNRYVENIIHKINELKEEAKKKRKISFKKYLRNKIKEQLNCEIDNIEELEYGDKRIKRILLLFNILTILQTQKSDMRFPFNRYKSENWDIEHVCSQTEKKISENKRIAWVDDILDYFAGTTDINQAENFIEDLNSDDEKDLEIYSICDSLIKLKKADNIEDEKFSRIFEQVQKYFKEDAETEQKDDISNLSLLDSTTNRSYGNSFFPIKRKRIIENDSKGIFVPIATKNLFLKYYSGKLGDVMHWNSNDAQDYLKAIKTTLEDFFKKSDSYHG